MREKWHGVILLSNRCNLRCTHCDVWRENSTSLSVEQLEQIADYRPNKVNLMGGEPLMYEHIDRALEIFSKITLQTNGLLVPEKIKMLENVRQVILSIEGTRETTDSIRGSGTFDKVMNSMNCLKEIGIPVLLRSSLWEGNLREVPEMSKMADDMGVGLYFFPMIGSPPLTVRQQNWLFKVLSEHGNVWLDQPNYFCALNRESYCSAGESRLAFQPDGRITPCQFIFDYEVGLVGDDFSLVSENANTFVDAIKRPPSECLGCSHQRCRGGCLLTKYYFGCPNRPEIKDYVEFGSFGGNGKSEGLKRLLSGVVTC